MQASPSPVLAINNASLPASGHDFHGSTYLLLICCRGALATASQQIQTQTRTLAGLRSFFAEQFEGGNDDVMLR